MKILFYNHTGQVSGAERLLLMILRRLDRHRFDPAAVCPDQGALAELLAELSLPVETVARLDARFTWRLDLLARYLKSFFGVMQQLRRSVIKREPDLIHANSIRAGLVATVATFGLGTTVVWHLHDMLPRHPISTAIRLMALFSRRLRMIAVSQAVADNFQGACFPLRKRVTVILNSIELDRFCPGQRTREAIRAELEVTEAAPLIGIVGQLTPRKGQLELLHSFAKALKEIPRAVLVIVGSALFNRDSEYAQLLQETVRKLGIDESVQLVGERSDIPAVMQALDLLVINSTVEPFGLVALEAMACNTPILASISGGIPELIEHNVNGWLAPQGDQNAMTDALVRLSQQPELRARFAAEGQKHIVAGFSAERYLTELESFYHSQSTRESSSSKELPQPQPVNETRWKVQPGSIN